MPLFAELTEILEQINSHRLCYELQQHTPVDVDSYLNAKTRLSAAEERELRGEFDNNLEGLFRQLFHKEDGERTISTVASWDIMGEADNAVTAFGFFDISTDALRLLKEQTIRYQQETLMQRVKSCVTRYDLCRNMPHNEEPDLMVPPMTPREKDQQKVRFAKDLEVMLADMDPDNLATYFGWIEEAQSTLNDHDTAAKMLHLLAQGIFEWCLTPTEIPKADNAGHIPVLLQLEEIQFRLNTIKKNWNWDFGYDYTEGVDNYQIFFEAMREQIGGEAFIRMIDEGSLDLGAVFKKVASAGPMQLDLALKYTDILSREIQNRVYGRNMHIEEYEKPKSCIVIQENKRPFSCKNSDLVRYGFSQQEAEQFEDVVFGIESAYTVVDSPPRAYPLGKQLPPDMEKQRGNVNWARGFRVIDLYRTHEDIPAELKQAYQTAQSADDTRLLEAAEHTVPPQGNGQILIPYDSPFIQKDMSDERRGILPESISTHAPGTSSGTHDAVRKLSRAGPYNHMMTKEMFVMMAKTKRP